MWMLPTLVWVYHSTSSPLRRTVQLLQMHALSTETQLNLRIVQ